MILADLVWWYKPKIERDETDGAIVDRQRQFSGDKLQRSYNQWADLFNVSKRQIKDSVNDLVRLGLVETEFRTVDTGKRKLPNVMFIEPVVDTIRSVTFGVHQRHIYDVQTSHTPRSNVRHIQKKNKEQSISIEKEDILSDGVTLAESEPVAFVTAVVAEYDTHCASTDDRKKGLPKMRNVFGSAAGKTVIGRIKTRSVEYDLTIKDWREYFQRVMRSPFLTGKNNRNWTASLGWLVNATNFSKVDQGDFDDHSTTPPPTPNDHGDLYVE